MDKVVSFNFEKATGESKSIRVVIGRHGEPWFVSKDVAEAIGYSDTYSLTRNLFDNEKNTYSLPSHGGIQEFSIFNELGLYSLIMRSSMPDADRLEEWLKNKVLKGIRKHRVFAATQKEAA